jgi:hypothetical protein
MKDPVPPTVRNGRAAAPPSPEVERVKALYLRALRSRVREGTYFTPRRVDLALKRMFQAIRDDLPQDPID